MLARHASLFLVVAAPFVGGCYESFGPDAGAPVAVPDAGPVDASVPPPLDAGPVITETDDYELVYRTIPASPWLDEPPSGPGCWPVTYAEELSEEAVSNLVRALASWEAPCSRFCFDAPTPTAIPLTDLGTPGLHGGVDMTTPSEPEPLSAGECSHGFFGDRRTERVAIHLRRGQTPTVRQWAKAIGQSLALRVTEEGVRDGVRSVLLDDGAPDEGATDTDRGALCQLYPR